MFLGPRGGQTLDSHFRMACGAEAACSVCDNIEVESDVNRNNSTRWPGLTEASALGVGAEGEDGPAASHRARPRAKIEPTEADVSPSSPVAGSTRGLAGCRLKVPSGSMRAW